MISACHVCMAEARTRVFITLVSSAKVFISSVKRVHLYRQCRKMGSSLAINMFICSVILYLEMSSRNYPITSD